MPPLRGFTLRFPGEQGAVRPALRQVRDKLEYLGLDPDQCGTVELVLAEALNNIAEHAYAGRPAGPVTLTAQLGADALRIVLRDRGREMPGGQLPDGALPASDVPCGDLPEGGFGWFLIRDLTRTLHYCRDRGENRLELEFGRDAPPDLADDGAAP